MQLTQSKFIHPTTYFIGFSIAIKCLQCYNITILRVLAWFSGIVVFVVIEWLELLYGIKDQEHASANYV